MESISWTWNTPMDPLSFHFSLLVCYVPKMRLEDKLVAATEGDLCFRFTSLTCLLIRLNWAFEPITERFHAYSTNGIAVLQFFSYFYYVRDTSYFMSSSITYTLYDILIKLISSTALQRILYRVSVWRKLDVKHQNLNYPKTIIITTISYQRVSDGPDNSRINRQSRF